MLRRFLCKCILRYQRGVSAKSLSKCKFYPTCSNYALEAIDRYGALVGVLISFIRIIRCNEFSSGGVDLVPKKIDEWYILQKIKNSFGGLFL